MSKNESNMIGLAGEFRIMSELLLRGHNPAKSYLESGADLILENGLRIEVKSSRRRALRQTVNGLRGYRFSLKGGGRDKAQCLDGFDFIICWCIDDDVFYIIPSPSVKASGVTFVSTNDEARHQYRMYKNNWESLRRL